jgi:ketosteroid isomerase-like protein
MRDFYWLIDDGQNSAVAQRFAENIVYHRPGTDPIKGREALEFFYNHNRGIASGQHTLSKVIATAHDIAVHGSFRGVLTNGEEVGWRFADFFQLDDDGLFARRDTFFFVPVYSQGDSA